MIITHFTFTLFKIHTNIVDCLLFLLDITAAEFVANGLGEFQTWLAGNLPTAPINIEVFTVIDVPGETRMVDVQYAAHGSPYYTPAKMNGLVWANKASVSVCGYSSYWFTVMVL